MTGSGQLAPGVTPSAAAPGDEQGVDVASFQHPNGAAIDWSQVAASGIGFAAVKVTEGDYYRNPYALTDLAQAQAAGLSVAAYAFAIPNGNGSSSNPVTQADYLLSDLGAQSRTVPIMLDIEYNPYGAECYGLTTTAMVSWITKFDSEIKARTGRLPIIYTPKAWWAACTGSSTGFGHIPLWVPTTPAPAARRCRPAGAPGRAGSTPAPARWPGSPHPGQVDLDQANPAILALLDPGNQKQTTGDPVGLQLQQAIPAPGPDRDVHRDRAARRPVAEPGRAADRLAQARRELPRCRSAHPPRLASLGSVSFGWTVAAAPDQGPAGPVRFGVGGKCLNDTGNKSADGTPLNLWTCNGSSSQQWTAGPGPDAADTRQVPGRSPGRPRPTGPRPCWPPAPASPASSGRSALAPSWSTRPPGCAWADQAAGTERCLRPGSRRATARPTRSGRCRPGRWCREVPGICLNGPGWPAPRPGTRW